MKLSPDIALDPELRAALAKADELSAALGPVAPGIAAVRERAALGRRYWNEGGPEMAAVEERTIPGPQRAIPVVLYRPRASERPLPVFVYLHGGGFKIGNQWSNDRQMRELAQAWGGIVISADYLHVPEHVFPAAVDETAVLLQWLHEHGASLGIDGERIAVGGSSAGANLAFGSVVALRGQPWVRACVGIVGAFNGDADRDSVRAYGNAGLFPDGAAVPQLFQDYVPEAAQRKDPRADLLVADPKLLPPSFLAAAEYDVFRDASLALAERLRSAGRSCELKVYPGMSHLFFGFSRSVRSAAECGADIAAFLARQLPA